jgi:DNA-binding IclR family transcriptional regulator
MPRRKSDADQERVLTQTLERGLQVLRAFRCEAKPLRNSTIANRAGLPRPTVSRITNTLVGLGYLNRITNGSEYQLGTRIFSIGEAYLKATRVRAIARPIIERFVAEHGVSIGIAAPDSLQMTYILWCKEPNALTFRLGAGAMLPMGWTAIGKAYLWALPPTTRRSLIAQLKTDAGGRASVLSTAIQRAFRDLDNDGYCVSMAEFQKNTFGIAAPLVLDEGRTVLSVGGGGARLDISESALRRAIVPDLLRVVQIVQDAVNADGGA